MRNALHRQSVHTASCSTKSAPSRRNAHTDPIRKLWSRSRNFLDSTGSLYVFCIPTRKSTKLIGSSASDVVLAEWQKTQIWSSSFFVSVPLCSESTEKLKDFLGSSPAAQLSEFGGNLDTQREAHRLCRDQCWSLRCRNFWQSRPGRTRNGALSRDGHSLSGRPRGGGR